MPNGSDKVTGVTHQPYESEKSIEDNEIRTLLQTSLKPKKKSKKKKTKKADDGKADGGDAEMET